MRAALLVAALLVACGPKDEAVETAADSTPPAPTGLVAADLAGTWNFSVMPADRDTVVTTGHIVFSADATTFTQTATSGGEPAEGTATIAGDVVNTTVGPYSSYLRPGVTVTTTGSYRMEGGRLVGTATARYAGVTTADSVMQLRVTMIKVN